jgi:hypothetical protein
MPVIDIFKWPCVILSSQRTGSSALVKLLANQYNVPYYIEPFEQKYRSEEFLQIYKNLGTKFILKCMIDRVSYHKAYNELIYRSDVFKIRLYRQNTVAQVASMYVAIQTGNWFGNQLHGTAVDVDMTHYKVPINNIEILRSAKLIIKNNNLFKLNRYKCDLTVSYESLGIVDENIWKRTCLPINYNDVIQATHNVLTQQRIQNNFILDL